MKQIIYSLSITLFLFCKLSIAQLPGSLDSSFDGDGKAFIDFGYEYNFGEAVAIQTDGKIIEVGSNNSYFLITRLNNNGSLDNSFDNDGKVQISLTGGDDFPTSVIVQPDGKILVAGDCGFYNATDFGIVRLNSNGSLDNSFNGNGKVIINVSGINDLPHSLALQPDGKILLAGWSRSFATNLYFFSIVRLNSNGTLDSSFNGNGKKTFNAGLSKSLAYSVAIQPDYKILVGGFAYDSSTSRFAVVRLNTNGSFDSSFDGDGKALVQVGVRGGAYSMMLQPNGKIVMAGPARLCDTCHGGFGILRLNSNGSVDSSFDADGKTIVRVNEDPSFDEWATAIALQSDGKIIVGGNSGLNKPFDYNMAVIRLNANGTFDNSFNGNGKALIGLPLYVEYCESLALQEDGKIILGGYGYGSPPDSKHLFMVTRLFGGSNAITVSAKSSSITEGNSGKKNLSFVVKLSSPAVTNCSVQVKTVPVTATKNLDYKTVNDTLEFAIGDTAKIVVVKLISDTIVEPNETFKLKLFNPVNLSIGSNTAKGTIVNDDTAFVSITSLLSEKILLPDKLSLYPNPSTGAITLTCISINSGKVQLMVYDIAGRLLFTKAEQAIKGVNTYQLNLSRLTFGNYYLQLNNGNQQQRAKFVIQK